jgi:hypothetical protein
MKEKRILDSFILTFQDNAEPVITMHKHEIVVAPWLNDLTSGEAKYIGKNDYGIEIAIPIPRFLEIQNMSHFQSKCSRLIRLRTSARTILHRLCYPISHIDNKIK